MAGYREHISVSGILGAAYGCVAVFMLGFTIVQAAIAGVFTWVAGMLPDLDSESGRPIQELSGLTAAIAPLILMQHVHDLGMNSDRAMLCGMLTYAAVRYGGAWLLGKLTVHRGMFHSIPALLIASELTYLFYHSNELRVRILMGVGVGIGFLSHLVLDEMYSVQWSGSKIKLAKSAGSALKFFGPEALPNGVAFGLMIFLSYATLVDANVVRDPGKVPAPEIITTTELEDAPLFRIAEQTRETQIQ
jgi:LexA-binding, inner membrane-associated putative hydrolase